jgi:hypothetical protein
MSIQYNSSLAVNEDGQSNLSATTIDIGTTSVKVDKVLGVVTNYDAAADGVIYNGTTMKVIYLLATQPLVIKINSTGSPDVTITLKANIALRWSTSEGYFSNPCNFNVTHFYITTTVACILKVRVLT